MSVSLGGRYLSIFKHVVGSFLPHTLSADVALDAILVSFHYVPQKEVGSSFPLVWAL